MGAGENGLRGLPVPSPVGLQCARVTADATIPCPLGRGKIAPEAKGSTKPAKNVIAVS